MPGSAANLVRLGGPEKGPPVLLIHGFGADRLGWTFTAPALQSACSVWAVDLPGHGAAGNHLETGSIGELADSVFRAISGRIASPLTIIGHSLGGAVARVMAGRLGPQAERLILLSPAGLLPVKDETFVIRFAELASVDAAEAHLKRMVVADRLISRRSAEYVFKGLTDPTRRRALRRIARQLILHPMQLDGLAADTICIWGAQDAIIPADETALCGIIRDLHIIPGIGHLPHVEATGKVNCILLSAVA